MKSLKFLKRSWDLSAGAAIFVLWGFVAFLLWTNYVSRLELQNAAMGELKQDIDKRATAVSYFFSERKNDIKNLVSSSVFSTYFECRSPDMSPKSGLETCRIAVAGEFQKLIDEKLLDEDRIYTRFVFLADDGEILVDARSVEATPSMGRNWADLLTPDFSGIRIIVEHEEQTLGTMLSCPCRVKGQYAGQIVAWVSPVPIYKHLVKDDRGSLKRSISLVSTKGQYYPPIEDLFGYTLSGPLQLKGSETATTRHVRATNASGREEKILVNSAAVKGTPFTLVSLCSARNVFGRTAPHHLLLGMGALALLVLGGMGLAWEIKARNLVLQTRLEDAAKREREVEEKNAQLETEIGERNRVEKALRASEEKYRAVVDHADEAIFIVQDGLIRFPNPRALELTGYSKEEFEKLSLLDLIHPGRREAIGEKDLRKLRGEEPIDNHRFPTVNKAGETRWLQLNSVPSAWEGKPATLNFVRDITIQHNLEAQLLHAQKMEAVGTLAGGIAHDFNNLLQAIQGYAELLLLDKLPRDPAYRPLNQIFSAANRGSELTRQLLTFSQKIDSKPRQIDLNEQVRQSVELLGRTIPKMIAIELDLAPDLGPLDADPAQLEQVLINLAVNSRDAMPGGGTITVRTRRLVLDENFCRAHMGSKPGEYLCLSFSDTGHGMDKETMVHIFEPFYSTKGVGRGTGLGLAMVYGIVKSHGGYITCDSRPGEGTTFRIYLPLAREGEAVEAENAPPEFNGAATGRVLLVDNDDFTKDFGLQILTRFGYEVVCARDGESALELYRDRWKSIDLVVLDLLMPNMSGKTCLEKMRQINPEVRAVLASGYSPDGAVSGVAALGARGFIHKPYEIKQMIQMLRAAML